MKSEHTPLYTRTYDLTRYLLQRTTRFPKNQRFVLARRIEDASLELLESIVLALQERHRRDDRLRSADEALTRLRLATRLCRDLKLLRQNQLEYICQELAEIGRMVGGFRKARKLSHADP